MPAKSITERRKPTSRAAAAVQVHAAAAIYQLRPPFIRTRRRAGGRGRGLQGARLAAAINGRRTTRAC